MAYIMRPSLFDDMTFRGGVNNPWERMFIEPFASRTTQRNSGLTVALNVYEDATHYYVLGVLPGIDASQLDISIKENVLTISGEYNFSNWPQNQTGQEQTKLHTLLSEVSQGKFSRQLKLIAAVDSDKIEAQYENGVLKLTLPKAERSLPKKISVSVAPQLNTVQS